MPNSPWRWTRALPPPSMSWHRRRWPRRPPRSCQPVQVLRTPGALDNVYRTLQTLPGVAATEEFGSRLAVRGGSPDQNLTMMDGVEIHDPYRLFGLTSAFNPETIQRFELATGGFSVQVRRPPVVAAADRESRRHAAGRRSPGRRRSASPTPTSSSRAGSRATPSARGWSPGAAPTTTSWPRASPTRSFRPSPTCRPRACGSRRPAARLTVFGLQQPSGRRDRDRRRRCAGGVPGRHRERPGVGALRCVARHAWPVAHGRRLLRHAIDLRRRCRRSRTPGPAFERARRR